MLPLDELPDRELDRLAELGFNWLWLLGVWQTGSSGAQVSRSQASWRPSFEEALPDLTENDIVGSTFAITAYRVHADFGGNEALARLRSRLRDRRIELLLDFVANHTALDHPWSVEHPEYYVAGTEADLAREPQNYTRVGTGPSSRILAHGRDPYFPGWPDTLQLNYGREDVQKAMLEQLYSIAALCDGVRCDMAMLLLPEIFEKTWNIAAAAFWPGAITSTRQIAPDFLFLAEVYWGLEWELQQQEFDYTYDKTLYDRLLHSDAGSVRAHLGADMAFQNKLTRFLENHDEPRIAAILPVPKHKAAAMVAFFVPGMRLLHDGQLDGCVRKPSIHLARRCIESPNPELQEFYRRLLLTIENVASEDWRLLEPAEAWSGNPTHADFVAFGWVRDGSLAYLCAVNYADHRSQCYLPLPWSAQGNGGSIVLRDFMGPATYERSKESLRAPGLYLDLEPWGYHLFRIEPSTG